MNKIIILFLILLIPCININLINSAVEIGSSDTTSRQGVVIDVPETPINYSLIPTVNSSDFWDDLDTPFDIATGELFDDGTYLTSFTESDPFSLHLSQDNWFNDPNNWITWETSNTITFNESKLTTTYYNATQSSAITGTIDDGTLQDTQHPDGSYDGVTFNFSEASGSPGLDLRINFTSVDAFNRGMIRYKTSSLSGAYPVIQLWNYDDSVWEDYPPLSQSLSFATIEQGVFDDSHHIGTGVDLGKVQMRLYKVTNGNINNKYYVDWLAVSKGYGTPAGEEVDPKWTIDKPNYLNTTQLNSLYLNLSGTNANQNINLGNYNLNASNITSTLIQGINFNNVTVVDNVVTWEIIV